MPCCFQHHKGNCFGICCWLAWFGRTASIATISLLLLSCPCRSALVAKCDFCYVTCCFYRCYCYCLSCFTWESTWSRRFDYISVDLVRSTPLCADLLRLLLLFTVFLFFFLHFRLVVDNYFIMLSTLECNNANNIVLWQAHTNLALRSRAAFYECV